MCWGAVNKSREVSWCLCSPPWSRARARPSNRPSTAPGLRVLSAPGVRQLVGPSWVCAAPWRAGSGGGGARGPRSALRAVLGGPHGEGLSRGPPAVPRPSAGRPGRAGVSPLRRMSEAQRSAHDQASGVLPAGLRARATSQVLAPCAGPAQPPWGHVEGGEQRGLLAFSCGLPCSCPGGSH